MGKPRRGCEDKRTFMKLADFIRNSKVNKASIRDVSKQMFYRMETDLQERCKPEERMFALHPDEDHIIVSHVLFMRMSKTLANRLQNLKSLYLLRKYEEEMLAAFSPNPKIFPNCCAIAILLRQ